MSKRRLLILLVALLIIIAYQLITRIGYDSNRNIKWGVAFSKPYAVELGLDWKKLYTDMFDDLGVKAVRLSVYWNDVEMEQNSYDFVDYDWMMDEALTRGAEVIMVVGQRLPRWPECHRPEWLNKLSPEQQDKELLEWIEKAVNRYKRYENITMWQVENEPFLTLFGECEKVNEKLLRQEVELVKSLDSRPVLITDSGELSLWMRSSKVGDYLGTTVYRQVYNPIIGYWSYSWLPATTYRFKARLNNHSWDKMLISELQTEPWYPDQKSALTTPLEEQFKSMNVEKFNSSIRYAQRIGFPQSYLWGVEWWWWLKESRGDDRMWEEARRVFGSTNKSP
jgi:hypothetical protein